MSIFKRGNVYWYHFMFNGEHVQRSTKQGNPRMARQIEAAFRTALAKGEVGITERKKAPGFKTAMREFLAWSEMQHEQHPRDVPALSGEQRGPAGTLRGSATRQDHSGFRGTVQGGPFGCQGAAHEPAHHARDREPGTGVSKVHVQSCNQGGTCPLRIRFASQEPRL